MGRRLLIVCLLATGAAKGNMTKPDWTHVFLTVTEPLTLPSSQSEGQTAAALRAACADLMTKHSSQLRRAAIAQWEVCLRTADGAAAWRVVVSSPTGEAPLHQTWVLSAVGVSLLWRLTGVRLTCKHHCPTSLCIACHILDVQCQASPVHRHNS